MKSVAVVASSCALALVAASGCGASRRADPFHGTSEAASASATASAKAEAIDPRDAHGVALAWTAIGCFVGGPWSEALGAVAEERTLADVARCREVQTKLLEAKPNDEETLDALRAIDAQMVERVIDAVSRRIQKMTIARKNVLISVLRASADAARESIEIRRIAMTLQEKKQKKETTIDDATLAALGTTHALERLQRVDGVEAKVVFLVLAADRLESARRLPPRASIAVGAPAMRLLFGVVRKNDGADDAHAWSDLLVACGKTAKHPPKHPSKNDELRDTQARMDIAAALAEKFDEARASLTKGVVLEVATGYVDRLRAEIAEELQEETTP